MRIGLRHFGHCYNLRFLPGSGLNRNPSSMCLRSDENIDVLESIIFHKEHVALLTWNLTKL